jgi:hypothetical protein
MRCSRYNELREEGAKSFKETSQEHPRGKEPLLKEEQFKIKRTTKKRQIEFLLFQFCKT